MAVDLDAVDVQHLAELRRVDHVDLEEQHVGSCRDRVQRALFASPCRAYSAASPAWRWLAMRFSSPVVGAGVGDEPAGGLVELDVVGAQLGGAGDPGDQRDDDDADDEQRGDGDAVGLLDDVLDQRVEQDQGEQREPDGARGAAGGGGRRSVTATAPETIIARMPVA